MPTDNPLRSVHDVRIPDSDAFVHNFLVFHAGLAEPMRLWALAGWALMRVRRFDLANRLLALQPDAECLDIAVAAALQEQGAYGLSEAITLWLRTIQALMRVRANGQRDLGHALMALQPDARGLHEALQEQEARA